jgi:hypothetical protein
MPFDAVPIGTWDAGIILDADGRRFGRTMIVTAAGDGGVRARQVTVRTEWVDFFGGLTRQRNTQSTIFISEIPDAGL